MKRILVVAIAAFCISVALAQDKPATTPNPNELALDKTTILEIRVATLELSNAAKDQAALYERFCQQNEQCKRLVQQQREAQEKADKVYDEFLASNKLTRTDVERFDMERWVIIKKKPVESKK
jgi:hypothetical protein